MGMAINGYDTMTGARARFGARSQRRTDVSDLVGNQSVTKID